MPSQNQGSASNRNFDFVPLPPQKPLRVNPISSEGANKFGHDQYWFNDSRFSGKLLLRLTAKTSVAVNSGIVELGSDLAQESNNPTIANRVKSIPLIKSSVRKDGKLIIPGSSFKGVVRSMYEAITRSCISKTKVNLEDSQVEYKECKNLALLCPACLVFGAMGWQGCVHFTDAECQSDDFQVKKIPSLFSPKPKAVDLETGKKVYFDDVNSKLIRGRKFYPHTYEGSAELKLQVQHAEVNQSFTTYLHCINLTTEQLGALLIVLGLEQERPLKLKVGGGKGVGMGSITVEATRIEELKCDRYQSYTTSSNYLEGEELERFIQSKIKNVLPQISNQSITTNLKLKPKPIVKNQLVQLDQLQILKTILQAPDTVETGARR